jgi:hypothetical protein
MTKETLQKIRQARAVSTPILAIATADPMAAVLALADEYDPAKNPAAKAATPIVLWDSVRGYQAANGAGADVVGALTPPDDGLGLPAPAVPFLNPVEALRVAYDRFPRGTFACYLNAHRLIDGNREGGPMAIQAICNLRDAFKGSRRTAILLAPSWVLPAELAQDVMVLDDPLPSAEELADVIKTEIAGYASSPAGGAGWTAPTDTEIADAAASLTGLARFPAEQTIATTLQQAGRLDDGIIWSRKRPYIAQTPGLTVETVRETLADVKGLDAIAGKFSRLMRGREAPRVIVRMEELEKVLGGARGDSSGTSQDQLAVLLTAMEDFEWEGLIGFGVPGSGKSLLSRAIGGEFQRPVLTLDMGALKGSLVGQSEQAVRAAVKTIRAIAGPRAYFIASCNGVATIPAALQRRFTSGIWFFDTPSPEALADVWGLYRAKYGIDAADVLPSCVGWTPAEVRNCCRTAYREGLSLADAAAFVVPVSRSDKEGIAAMRKLAHGSFLDASTGRTYVDGSQPAAPGVRPTAERIYGGEA